MPLENPRFQESYERLFGMGTSIGTEADAFFERFYEVFLADPEVAELFRSTDMQIQVTMLKKSLLNLISFYVLDAPTAELTRLAEIHRKIGISSQMFDVWLDALVQVVAEYDPQFTEATALGWCWALTPGITFMRLTLMAPTEPPSLDSPIGQSF